MSGYGHGSYIPFRINYNRCKSPHHKRCPKPPAKLKTGVPFTGGGIPSTIATPATKMFIFSKLSRRRSQISVGIQ